MKAIGCRLNVFTPAINDGKKRSVMVWLHGGGFTNGNGIEQDGYNGENFCRFGDAVFVSVKHRLGPMGFSNFGGVAGEKFAASGNVGMLDLVAALEWVRDNITNFGGDPGNVTIMGQSGGGAKVTTLTAMPSAKGLIHRAVVLSGAGVKTGEKEYSEKLGAYIPQHPYFPEAASSAADVPMIICSTMNVTAPSRTDASLENITLDEVKERVKRRAGFGAGFGDKSGEVVDTYAYRWWCKTEETL
jgi:para-nitrobenzyl esterase